jgi:tyrosyl-tRNA synthetase
LIFFNFGVFFPDFLLFNQIFGEITEMSFTDNALLRELDQRELISQLTAEQDLADHLDSGMRTVYCGFDPTADSLHIGSLVPLLTLKRFQEAGHRPIALVGGATGLIGDPSFKSQERQLNSQEVVETWLAKIQDQVSRFIDFDVSSNRALVVNNLDWIGGMDVLSFLRDVGKHFAVNQMIKKEAVKQRIEREGEGISFTEFSYMILQSYDFAQLNRLYDCTLQIGGSDQWGNITGGTELTRRMNGRQVFGATLPLVTKADGSKFGKTESGTIWLDPERTSPYAFYQFWLNTADADAYRFLRYFTFLSLEHIVDLEQADRERVTGKPEAQNVLAKEVCELVHGSEGLHAAQRITRALFDGDVRQLCESDLAQLSLDGLPSSVLPAEELGGKPLTTLLAECGMAKSGKQVKDALARGGLSVNGEVIAPQDNMSLPTIFSPERALYGRYYIIRLGKKNYHMLTR